MPEKDEIEKGKEIEDEAKNLSEDEIAVLANRQHKQDQEEIKALKKELAKLKLYSNAEEDDDESEEVNEEEVINTLANSDTCNYDYAVNVIRLCDLRKTQNKPNPLGENGEQVCDFFQKVIDACDGDKSRFPSIYQSMIDADNPSDALAYKRATEIK